MGGKNVRARCVRRGLVRLGLASGLLLVLAAPALGQVFDPNFRLYFTDGVSGTSGSVRTVECLLDLEPFAQELAGWTFGVCHDATELAPQSATAGAFLDTIQNGLPADFSVTESDPALGVTAGVVICFSSCATLGPPQVALPLVSVEYQLLAAPGTLPTMAYCDSVAIGGNPVPTLLVTSGAGQILPILELGTIEVIDLAFIRADCDADGSLTIADAVVALGALFGPGVLVCADACDTNDDGVLNIADPIATLFYLFSGGPPPEAPFPDCGADPSADSLDCGAAPAGC